MRSRRIELTLITILVASLFIGGSVHAWFSSEAEGAGNQITTGTLFLTVSESEDTSSQFTGVFPGWGMPGTNDDSMQEITAVNTGNGGAEVYISFENIIDVTSENGKKLSEYLYIHKIYYMCPAFSTSPNSMWFTDISISDIAKKGSIGVWSVGPGSQSGGQGGYCTTVFTIAYYMKEDAPIDDLRHSSLSFDVVITHKKPKNEI
ncbi:MAG: hypothetical protein GX369_06000 [Euryarchaeota archaeon]|nr:hypothetical protein [Euryarchaeota archaeon]